MAIDVTVTQVELRGAFLDFEGTPIVGQIKFSLHDMLRNSIANQMIVPSTITVTLDENGSFTTMLPATNDPDLIPVFLYTVEESFAYGRTYTLELPYTTTGYLDLADISPTPASPDTYYSMVLRVPWDLLVQGIDNLDAEINQTQDVIYLDGTIGAMNASATTYTSLINGFASYAALNAGPYAISAPELQSFANRAQAASDSAAASASIVSASSIGILNPLLLIGG